MINNGGGVAGKVFLRRMSLLLSDSTVPSRMYSLAPKARCTTLASVHWPSVGDSACQTDGIISQMPGSVTGAVSLSHFNTADTIFKIGEILKCGQRMRENYTIFATVDFEHASSRSLVCSNVVGRLSETQRLSIPSRIRSILCMQSPHFTT